MRTTKTPTKATKVTKPKRRRRPKVTPRPRATVTLAADLARAMEGAPPLPPPPTPGRSRRVLASAHEVADVTPCWTCGGPCEPGEDRHGPWRRHRDCCSIAQPWQRVRAVAAWFSIDVDEAVARVADLYVPAFSEGRSAAVYIGTDRRRAPWSQIKRKDVVRAVMQARQVLAEAARPGPCDLGPCGWCGAHESVDWTAFGHRRADGSEAALCESCAPIFDRLPGFAQYMDDQRGGIAEALTGVPGNLGEQYPDGLRAHAEVGGGDGTPWSHLPAEAVEAFRMNRWARQGGRYAPEDRKADVLAYLAERLAERQSQEAARNADSFGFSEGECP